jgi:hypothetical protein
MILIGSLAQVISVVFTSIFDASFSSDMDALVSRIIAHIIGIAVNGVILYYLYRPNVRAFFGKS